MSSFKDTLRFRNGPKHTNSPIGQLIETATDPNASKGGAEDWGLFMTICDAINSTEDGPKDATKAIRRRFALKTPVITVLTLKLLETCVKNCGKRFHVQIATKDFMQELIKIISPKYNPSVELQNQVLGLIQTWSHAFQSSPELKEVSKHYQELKAKGVEFPPLDADLASQAFIPEKSATPVAVTQLSTASRTMSSPLSAGQQTGRTVAVSQASYPLASGGYPAGYPPASGGYLPASGGYPPASGGLQQPAAERVAKLRTELSTVGQNCRVFGELLTEASSGQENCSDVELLEDLNTTCRQMQKRIVDLIETVQIEQITEELLCVNDELNNVFLRYDRYQRLRAGRTATPQPTGGLPVQPPSYAPPTYTPANRSASPTHQYLSPVQPYGEQQQRPATGYQPMSVSAGAGYQPAVSSGGAGNQPSEATVSDNVAVATLIDFESDVATTSNEPTNSLSSLAGLSLSGSSIDPTSSQQSVHAHPVPPVTDRESDIEEMERWLKANPAQGGGATAEPVTSSEFDDFLQQRVHDADQQAEAGRGGATAGQRSMMGSSGAELFSL